jgi:hypothetical protein
MTETTSVLSNKDTFRGCGEIGQITTAKKNT